MFDTEHLDDGTPNHEVGHALGLCDGGPGIPTPIPAGCVSNLDVYPPGGNGILDRYECLNSIMHSYGCSEPDWPTAIDIAAVESLQPSGSGEWHNFSLGPKGFL